MNLKEHIRTILREELNFPIPVLRRIRIDELEDQFEKSLDFAVRVYELRLTHLEQSEGIDKFIDLVIDKVMGYIENMVYEDLRWSWGKVTYDSIWSMLKEHYKDRIIEKYQKEIIEDYERASRLGKTKVGSGEDHFLKVHSAHKLLPENVKRELLRMKDFQLLHQSGLPNQFQPNEVMHPAELC